MRSISRVIPFALVVLTATRVAAAPVQAAVTCPTAFIAHTPDPATGTLALALAGFVAALILRPRN